jgi:uncharacterized protein YbjQ (UPF0145 family)
MLVVIAAVVALGACGNEDHPEFHPQSSYSVEQHLSYPTTVFQMGSSPPTPSNAPAERRPARGDPSHILVLESTHLDRPAEVVGVVDAHLPVGSHEAALDAVRRRAAEMGADAVVGVEFHHGEPGEEPTHLSGMAVRCNDLLKGREYDVLQKIEVKAKMGKEDDAETELYACARSLHADLVLDMGFEHGEGGSEAPRVWGTAIRFKDRGETSRTGWKAPKVAPWRLPRRSPCGRC